METQTLENVHIVELGTVVTDKELETCDIFIISRPSRFMSQNEINTLVSYVARGGSLLMTGMGWLWEAQNHLHDIDNFPLNGLGKHLGFRYSKTSIDKTYTDNTKGPQRCSFVHYQHLSKRHPISLRKYMACFHRNESIAQSIALEKERYYYVLEGDNVIVRMPYRFFKNCLKPVDFVNQLDTVYDLYAALAHEIKPFNGEKIVILNVDNMTYHMSSGNPILSREDRIEYILHELDKSDYMNPSWGLMHELGHDFIIGMNHYFVFGHGDNESWAEFFALYGCQMLGLTHKKPTWKETAKIYHESGEKDFERIKNDKWLMTGFLHHILDQYGWKIYKKLFGRYGERIKKNDYLQFDETEKKVNLFVKELSLAASANFYPYFKGWGFPVSQCVCNELKHLPEARLFDEF